MNARIVFLPAAAVMIGMAFPGLGLARTGTGPQIDHQAASAILLAQTPNMPGHVTAPSGAPVTGSQQGLGQPTGPGPMITSPPNVLPNTGSEAGAEPPTSMPPGHMAADPNRNPGQPSGPGPMIGSPGGVVPNTGSEAGAETPNSMPPGHMTADPNKR